MKTSVTAESDALGRATNQEQRRGRYVTTTYVNVSSSATDLSGGDGYGISTHMFLSIFFSPLADEAPSELPAVPVLFPFLDLA